MSILTEELAKLAALRDRGILTDFEFEAQKTSLLQAERPGPAPVPGSYEAPTPASFAAGSFLSTTNSKVIAASGAGIAAVVAIAAIIAGNAPSSRASTSSTPAVSASPLAPSTRSQPSEVAAPAADSGAVANGKYTCYAGGQYTFSDLYITGPHEYRVEPGGSGNFSYANGALTFSSGPYAGAYSRMIDGHTIGVSAPGSQNLGTQCGLEK
ncbi:MAG TPA: SHOCT domain-containing protein [Allosphingosinicella sp.]|jgi:hypothetical protein